MGQNFSSEPVVEKETERAHNDIFNVAVSSCQGWRMSQEDNHSLMLDLPGEHKAAFFAVYDGHGSDKVSKHASEALYKHLTQNELYTQGDFKGALEQAFLTFDREVHASYNAQLAGTTAICMLIVDNVIYCANVGDSRAVASVNCECTPLSYDHKPENPQELKRILAAGGYVLGNRVNGNLALSRAFGDFHYKGNDQLPPDQQIVSPCPDIKRIELNDDVDFIVLACDGIWDVLSSEEVVEFVISRLEHNLEPGLICEQLTTRCLATDYELVVGCDNMTVLLVCYTRGKSWEDYCTNIFEKNTKKLGVPTRTRIIHDIDTLNQEVQESRLRSEQQSSYLKSSKELNNFTRDTPSASSTLSSSFDSSDAGLAGRSAEIRGDRTNMLQRAADDMRILLNVFSNKDCRAPMRNAGDETPPITEVPNDRANNECQDQDTNNSPSLGGRNTEQDDKAKADGEHCNQSSSDDNDKVVEENSGAQQESEVHEITLSSPDYHDDDADDGKNQLNTDTVEQEILNEKDDADQSADNTSIREEDISPIEDIYGYLKDSSNAESDGDSATITNSVEVDMPKQLESISEEDISPIEDINAHIEKSDGDAAQSEPGDGEDGESTGATDEQPPEETNEQPSETTDEQSSD